MVTHWRQGQAYTACQRELDKVMFTQTNTEDVTCKNCKKIIKQDKTRKWAAKKLAQIRKGKP